MKDILGTLYLFWPAIIVGLILFTILSVLLGGAFVLVLLLLYYSYHWLKKQGVFDFCMRWIQINEKFIGDNLEKHLKQTFLLKGNVAKVPKDTAILYVAHPHGLFSMAPFLHWGIQVTDWPKNIRPIHVAVHSIFFKIPFVKELMESYGAIEATEDEIRRVLQSGDSVALLTGGVEELNKTESGKMKIVLKKRKGFLRIARDLDVPLIPVLTFGENELFPPIRGYWVEKFQDYLKKWFGIAVPIPTWQSLENWFSLLKGPLEQKVVTWVGEPVMNSKKENVEHIREKILHAMLGLYKEGRPETYPHTMEVF